MKLPQETMDLFKQYSTWYSDLQEANGDRWKSTEYINPHAFRHTLA
jgi:hypothetical protein